MLDTSDIYIICCPECQNVLLTDRIPVSISVYGSWVTDRQNAKIAYFKEKGVSDKITNKQIITLLI